MIKVNDFYEIEVMESKKCALGMSAYIKNKITGKKIMIPYSMGKIYLINDESLEVEKLREISKEMVEELVDQGKLLKLTWKDIWVNYVGIDEDIYLEYIDGYDKRTRLYLKKIIENIGLLGEKHGWDEEKFEIIKQYRIWINLTGSGYVDIGKLDDEKYIAQYSIQTDVDDYDVTRLYFDHMPTKNDIETVKLVDDIEFYFCTHKKSTFKCWDCGSEVHWLDTEGNLETKFENLKNGYCGC